MIVFGSKGSYEWLVTDQDCDLLKICPEIVIGKFIAISSFDSGSLLLSEEEKASGWESRNNLAYSPRVKEVNDLPRDGYDEWYVFREPFDLGISHLAENVFEVPQGQGHLSVFVNYGGFSLSDPKMNDLAELFWQQMECVRPESYIADGVLLNFACSNRDLFAAIRTALNSD